MLSAPAGSLLPKPARSPLLAWTAPPHPGAAPSCCSPPHPHPARLPGPAPGLARSLLPPCGVDGGMADHETRAFVELAAVLVTAPALSGAILWYGARLQRR